MDIIDFTSKLSEYGYDYHESQRSITVSYCPECGRNKYKVLFNLAYFDGDVLLGRCFSGSCGKKYNSISYLTALGIPYSEAAEVHGLNPEAAIKALVVQELTPEVVESIPEKKELNIDISGFYDIEDVPESSAAKYAIRRGYDSSLKHLIKLDIDSSAVVFLCKKENSTIGFQKRFIRPIAAKTDTAKDFIAGDNTLHYPNTGDIVIAEGPFTAIAAYRWGFDAFATFGSGVSKNQLEIIEKHAKATGKRILIAKENDEAGEKYTSTIMSHFSWLKIPIQIIEPEVGSDLNDSFVDNKGYIIKDCDFCHSLPNVANLF